MTKEITKAKILQEIQDKLSLREFASAKFLFDETVIPVYNIEKHLQNWEITGKAVSITSASGFGFYVVPQTERWYLRSYELVFGATGAHKASGAYIVRARTSPISIPLDLKAGQEVSYIVTLSPVVQLNPGDEIKVLFDTYVSTQSLTLRIDHMIEEIR